MAAVAATPGAKASAATPVRSHNEPATSGRTNAVAYCTVKTAALIRCTSPARASPGGTVNGTMNASPGPPRPAAPSRQLAHTRAGRAGGGPRLGPERTIAPPLARTPSDPAALAPRQSPCVSGSTPTGDVNPVGTVSPIRMPLL